MLRQYGLSKLGLIYFTKRLARLMENKGVTVNCIDPGAVKTPINSNLHFPLNIMILKMRIRHPKMWVTPKRCANTYLYLSESPAVDEITGQMFDNKERLVAPHPIAFKTDYAEKMWGLAAELTGVDISDSISLLES